jgi:hypothetical protein
VSLPPSFKRQVNEKGGIDEESTFVLYNFGYFGGIPGSGSRNHLRERERLPLRSLLGFCQSEDHQSGVFDLHG